MQPAEAFGAFGRHFVGVQTLFPQEEQAWDNGDPIAGQTRGPGRGLGRWTGPAPPHVECDLQVLAAPTTQLGHDVVALPANTQGQKLRVSLRGIFHNVFVGEPRLLIDGTATLRILIQSASTGSVLNSLAVPFAPPAGGVGFEALQKAGKLTLTIDLPDLSAGSSIIWCRVEDVKAAWLLPPDYYSVTGYTSPNTIPEQYRYDEAGNQLVWDWLRDVGRRPADPAQVALDGTDMYAAHQAAVLAGTLEHRGEWTTYIRDGRAQGCDWSALRVQVGEGEWAASEFTLPAPGAALHKLQIGDRFAVAFDPLARSVTASWREDDESQLIAGSIATSTGPALALWRLGQNVAGEIVGTLLGTHPNDQQFFCEMALLNNFASDILVNETLEGEEEIYVLSFGRLHRYDPAEPDIARALPGTPKASDGHPGGRCLRQTERSGTMRYFTESFLQNKQNTDGIFFYNLMREFGIVGGTPRPGTSFHGHNCAENIWGKLHGFTMNQPYGGPGAVQFLASWSGRFWYRSGVDDFPIKQYLWQRLRAVSTHDGLRLLVCGREANGENAIWGVDDSREFREAFLQFRPRRLTRSVYTKGAASNEVIFCVGRTVSTANIATGEVSTQWSVIAIGDLDGEGDVYVKKCLFWDEPSQAFRVARGTLEDEGFIVEKLTPFLWWEVDLQQNGGGVWKQKKVAPDDGRKYLQRLDGELIVEYKLFNGPLPYNPAYWGRICFTLYEDGGGGTDAIPPQPTCQNAFCVNEDMPQGTTVMFLTKGAGGDWDAIQVSDMCDIEPVTRLPMLNRQRIDYPLLWCRIDSDAPIDDLTSYTQLLHFDRLEPLTDTAKSRVDICVLVPPAAGAVRAPVIDKRN